MVFNFSNQKKRIGELLEFMRQINRSHDTRYLAILFSNQYEIMLVDYINRIDQWRLTIDNFSVDHTIPYLRRIFLLYVRRADRRPRHDTLDIAFSPYDRELRVVMYLHNGCGFQ